MTNYISIPIIEESVRFVEDDSRREDAVKMMASGIFNLYFTAVNGFVIGPGQNRSGHIPGFTIFRIQRLFPGGRGLLDHTVAKAKKVEDSVVASLEQLENALEQAVTEFGRCWALLIHGTSFMFYEYHRNLDDKLVPWGPPNDSQRNIFHARDDAAIVQWMLQHMAQSTVPPDEK